MARVTHQEVVTLSYEMEVFECLCCGTKVSKPFSSQELNNPDKAQAAERAAAKDNGWELIPAVPSTPTKPAPHQPTIGGVPQLATAKHRAHEVPRPSARPVLVTQPYDRYVAERGAFDAVPETFSATYYGVLSKWHYLGMPMRGNNNATVEERCICGTCWPVFVDFLLEQDWEKRRAGR